MNRAHSKEGNRKGGVCLQLIDSDVSPHCRTGILGKLQRGGGGKTYRAILGGETYYTVPPPTALLEASESGICLVCARFLQRKKSHGVNKWGGNVS